METIELADSHCHLDDEKFAADRAETVARAQAAGIRYLLGIGTGNGPPDLQAAVRLAEEIPFLYATVGVHPNDAAKLETGTLPEIAELLRHPKVKALGEIGLDYHWDVPKETQLPVFRQQLQLAAEAKMPVVIHTRDAWDDTLDVLKSDWAPTGLPCVMHCFTGDRKLAERCLELGFTLAFGGVVTYPKSAEIREAARLTPNDRLLMETDAPYLAPLPYRGKRNEPAFVRNTAEVLAELRAVTLPELASETTANFKRIFAIE